MQPVVASLAGFVFVAGGLLFLAFSLRAGGDKEVSLRLHEYVGDHAVWQPQRGPVLSFRQAELSGSFVTRVIQPWLTSLGRVLGQLTPARVMEDLRRQLAMAGNPWGLGAREFYGLRLLLTFVGLGLAFVMIRGALPAASASAPRPVQSISGASGPQAVQSPLRLDRAAASLLALLIFSRLPKTWLRRKARSRQEKIRKGLPDALDMLCVCAEAGLGFDQALQRVSERWKSPLAVEFNRVVAEMQMGVPRQTALRNLVERTDILELSSFVAVIIQSDQLGMSIAQTLRAQAEQMRVERRYRAQEAARKMPLKMLFPLMLLIFPAMFAVILGPSLPVLGNLFAVLGGNP
jgi:tight adherence protein C